MKLSTDQKRVQRSAARLYAVQALFQMEAAGAGAERVVREFETHRFGQPQEEGQELPEGHVDLFRRIVNDAVTHQARIDQMTDRALVAKWSIDRIDPTLRALFRAAGAEFVGADTPPRVVISEYLGIADAFYPGEDPEPGELRPRPAREKAFVNAILDHMAREARPEAFAG
jgi:N utilization substance protein B